MIMLINRTGVFGVLIACDNQISNDNIYGFHMNGFHTVTKAGHRADEDWVEEAVIRGAKAIISPDLDIPNLIQFTDVVWIEWLNEKADRYKLAIKELRDLRTKLRSKR